MSQLEKLIKKFCVKEAYIIELRKLFEEIISEQGGGKK